MSEIQNRLELASTLAFSKLDTALVAVVAVGEAALTLEELSHGGKRSRMDGCTSLTSAFTMMDVNMIWLKTVFRC